MMANFTTTLITGEVLKGTAEVCVQYWTYNPVDYARVQLKGEHTALHFSRDLSRDNRRMRSSRRGSATSTTTRAIGRADTRRISSIARTSCSSGTSVRRCATKDSSVHGGCIPPARWRRWRKP